MARIGVVLAVVLLLFLTFGSVSANNCDFNGTVHLDRGDLANYTSDQIGCATGRFSSNWGILIIAAGVFAVLLLIYGLSRRK